MIFFGKLSNVFAKIISRIIARTVEEVAKQIS